MAIMLFLRRRWNSKASFSNLKHSFRQNSSLSSIDCPRSRIGIGGSKLNQNTTKTGQYAAVIATSLQNGVNTFESGHGGEQNLTNAFQDAVLYLDSNKISPPDTDRPMKNVILTARFGYRSSFPPTSSDSTDIKEENSDSEVTQLIFPNDILVEDSDVTSNNKKEANTKQDKLNHSNHTNEINPQKGKVYHNISKEYVAHCLSNSPIVNLYKAQKDITQSLHNHYDIHLLYMAHNPEAQGVQLISKGAPTQDVREYVKERMIDAFEGLEIGVAEGLISSYGVCSNGLSLPSSHPLNLSWEDVLSAASSAAHKVHHGSSDSLISANLSTLQLPANLLETYGLKVAKDVKNFLKEENTSIPYLPKKIDIYTSRPLTCYPDRGIGDGYPFKLVDYQIPTSLDDSNSTQWTHLIPSDIPMFYTSILNETMGHFDATQILEASEIEGRKLSMEERETLDGCKLIQSMIHDLNNNLSSGRIRSFAAYEEELYTKIIPLIHDTFEELDEESALLLERFFRGHGLALRLSIAKTIRRLIRTGEEGGHVYDIRDDQSLQSFAIQYLLKQSFNDSPLIDKVIIGAPQPEHVVEVIQAADQLNSLE